jgi:hypothetical protein
MSTEKHAGVHIKVLTAVVQFYPKLNLFQQLLLKLSNMKVYGNQFASSRVVTCVQTDITTLTGVFFYNFSLQSRRNLI